MFRASDQFYSGDPDYDYVRAVVDKALYPPKKNGKREQEEKVENPIDVCAYQPDDESLEASE